MELHTFIGGEIYPGFQLEEEKGRSGLLLGHHKERCRQISIFLCKFDPPITQNTRVFKGELTNIKHPRDKPYYVLTKENPESHDDVLVRVWTIGEQGNTDGKILWDGDNPPILSGIGRDVWDQEWQDALFLLRRGDFLHTIVCGGKQFMLSRNAGGKLEVAVWKESATRDENKNTILAPESPKVGVEELEPDWLSYTYPPSVNPLSDYDKKQYRKKVEGGKIPWPKDLKIKNK